MPLTAKGEEILANMKKEYGAEKGEQIFYASKNAGTIAGVDSVGDKLVIVKKGSTVRGRKYDRDERLSVGEEEAEQMVAQGIARWPTTGDRVRVVNAADGVHIHVRR